MACGGDINFVDEEESMQHQPTPSTTDSISATELARHLGQVSLESSPILSAREPKFARKFSLRELEIQQTIGIIIIMIFTFHCFSSCEVTI
jgi:hypothetical protein